MADLLRVAEDLQTLGFSLLVLRQIIKKEKELEETTPRKRQTTLLLI